MKKVDTYSIFEYTVDGWTKFNQERMIDMADIKALKEKINNSGMTFSSIAKKSGILRETLYNRLNGVSDFTATEIVGLSRTLKLTKSERDDIFLNEKLNDMQP